MTIAVWRGRHHTGMSLAFVCAVALLLGALPPIAHAADAGIALTATRTDAQVRSMWQNLKPDYSGSPYVSTPSAQSPYAPGALSAGFLNDGLDAINFGRFLAGVPSDVALDATRNTDAQHGAVLLAASSFSHTPSKPADMSQDFYNRGFAATSQSNIGWGYSDSVEFQLGCLADDDIGNIDRLGHRRWLLNPHMRYTGIGFAQTRHTTYAFDRSRSEVDYAVVAYPSAGPFPVDQGHFDSSTPWSITLNPSRYDWDSAGHTVTLRRLSDGATWTFTSADNNKSGEYFNFETSGYGVANCFIFRPNPSSVSYGAGDEFEVVLSGGIYLEGTRTPATVSYRTRFISLEGSTSDTATSLTLTGPSNPPGYAGSARLTARLRSPVGAPLSGRTILFERWNGSNWVSLASSAADANGNASAIASNLRTRQTYRARFGGTPEDEASSSSKLYVHPKARLTRSKNWKSLRRGKTYYATGYIEPKHSAKESNKVKIRAYKKGRDGTYRYVKSFTASYGPQSSTKTRYTAKVVFPSKGSWRIRSYHAGDSKNAASFGSYDSFAVK